MIFFADYENTCESNELSLPDLICVITGKGPLRDFYIAIINLKNWKHVKIITPWLENEDYPKMLGIISKIYVYIIIDIFNHLYNFFREIFTKLYLKDIFFEQLVQI